MAFTVVQVGTTLQLMDGLGNLAALTLPTNVTLSTAVPARFALFNQYAVMANSPSRPITIDANGVVRVLSPRNPATPVVLSGVAGGSLTGAFKVKQTYRIRDLAGNIIAESDFGPESAQVAIAAKFLKVSGINLSNDTITSAMFYRTTSNGSVYFPWLEVEGNVQTSAQDDLADAGLSIVAAANLGSAPDLVNVVEYKGRLWGVDRVDNGFLRYTEAGTMHGWYSGNSIAIPRPGSDSYGITGLVARRDALGVARQGAFCQILGSGAADFRQVNVDPSIGIMNQETVQVNGDIAYFLSRDGVYTWDSDGLKCVSDGKTRSWFTTDTYFNRSKFNAAFSRLDLLRDKYQLFLCSAGSSTVDRWIELDLGDMTWWGPHKTSEFTPSSAFGLFDANNLPIAVIGSSSGYVWQEQATRTDGTSTAIDFDVDTKHHDEQTPRMEKTWLEPTIIGVAQTTGRMAVTPYVGELAAPAATQIQQADLTESAQSLGRIGNGKCAKLNFRENTPGQNVQLIGYELEYLDIGERLG